MKIGNYYYNINDGRILLCEDISSLWIICREITTDRLFIFDIEDQNCLEEY